MRTLYFTHKLTWRLGVDLFGLIFLLAALFTTYGIIVSLYDELPFVPYRSWATQLIGLLYMLGMGLFVWLLAFMAVSASSMMPNLIIDQQGFRLVSFFGLLRSRKFSWSALTMVTPLVVREMGVGHMIGEQHFLVGARGLPPTNWLFGVLSRLRGGGFLLPPWLPERRELLAIIKTARPDVMDPWI
ncbi:MAG: hypothetical protein KDE59_06105 [Anaerolineales bacterium]|nr:hypothetical protein [Anaerolineales bacterium]